MELNTVIVGAHFRPSEARQLLNDLEPGDRLYLSREPDNKFDVNAIQVLADDGSGEQVHVGYVPRQDNAVLAALMDNGDAEPRAVLFSTGKNPGILIKW